MLKFIPGILLLQVITIALVLIAPADLENWGWLRLALPVLIAGFFVVTALPAWSWHARHSRGYFHAFWHGIPSIG